MKLELLERGSIYILPSKNPAQFQGRTELAIDPKAEDFYLRNHTSAFFPESQTVLVFRYVDIKTRMLTKNEVHFTLAGFKLIEHNVTQGYLYD